VFEEIQVTITYASPASFAMLKKADCLFLSSSEGDANSDICPLSNTITLSESKIVLSRWAMTRTVHSLNSVRMVFYLSGKKKRENLIKEFH
jgi:hypothetical protein